MAGYMDYERDKIESVGKVIMVSGSIISFPSFFEYNVYIPVLNPKLTIPLLPLISRRMQNKTRQASTPSV
jgi:hypothetical protein